MSAEESLSLIAERLESVRTVSAECGIVMTDGAGETVRLDGAVAAEPPSRVRLRAWKLGRAVFDVTLLDGRVWLLAPDDRAGIGHADRLREVPGMMGPGFFRSALVIEGRTTPQRLVVAGPGPGGSRVICEIDRATLTPRLYREEGGTPEDVSLLLDRYAVVNGVAWPMRATMRRRDGGVVVTFHSVEINGGLPEGALVPPARAVLQP